jgi:hypothetical protein
MKRKKMRASTRWSGGRRWAPTACLESVALESWSDLGLAESLKRGSDDEVGRSSSAGYSTALLALLLDNCVYCRSQSMNYGSFTLKICRTVLPQSMEFLLVSRSSRRTTTTERERKRWPRTPQLQAVRIKSVASETVIQLSLCADK